MNAEEAAKNLDPQVIKTYQDAVALAQAEGDQQDMPKAVELMEQAAEAGHPMAQCNMGYFYTFSEAVEVNHATAAAWYQQSADQGVPQAMFNLARLYRVGSGVEESAEKSLALLREAATLGHPESLHNLGIFHFAGEMGVAQDYQAAAVFFENAAQAKYAPSLYSLGLCYSLGYGVEQDEVKALTLYEDAARIGDTNAAFNLGLYHYHGKGGLEVNPQRAKELFGAAAAHGHAKARAAFTSIENNESLEESTADVTE
jgi:TPR repeat protein